MQTLSKKMNDSGMADRSAKGTLWRAFGVALLFACQAVSQASSGGALSAFGLNSSGQATPPPSTSANVIAVAGGANHSLALKNNGTVVAFGLDLFGQTNVPVDLTNAVAISAGSQYSMALRADGTVTVWGTPLQPPPSGLGNVIAIAAGWQHSLALKGDGTVVAWGDNSAGETNVPPTLANVVAVSAGDNYSVALRADGTVVAWGDGTYNKTTVPANATNVVSIAAGGDHILALRNDGSIVAWGRNDKGQCNVPANANNVVVVAAGALHSLAVLANGTLAGWGDNTYGQATVGPIVPGFFTAAAGGYHSLVVKGDGSPVIVVQPVTQSVLIGTATSFQVLAGGNQPLSYQWQKNGAILPGATTSSYSFPNVQLGDAGTYTVVVSNALASVVSSAAVLTPLGSPPHIFVQPQDTNVVCGVDMALSVVAQGPQPLTNQWRFQGTPIPGATDTSLVFAPVVSSNAGPYDVVVSCPFGAITSSVANLSVSVTPPSITSPLTATAAQGVPFSYQITALNNPISFDASPLPKGLSVNTTNGLITGTNYDLGTFGIHITAYSLCDSDTETLILTNTSSAPTINGPLTASGTEGADFSFTVTANNRPVTYSAVNLPIGLVIDPASGLIAGQPAYAGTFTSTVTATNLWGSGSTTLVITINNAPIGGLAIANVTTNYSSPYLLDFQFSLLSTNLVDSSAQPFVVDTHLLSVDAYEDQDPVSTEDKVFILKLLSPQVISLKAVLVLDFCKSIADIQLNGNSGTNGISDAINAEVLTAETFVNEQASSAQLGVVEFNRDDFPPKIVIGITNNQPAVVNAIGGIWTNYVNGFTSGSRCWDALMGAVNLLGPNTNLTAQSCIIFVSDGADDASTNTITAVVTAAAKNNVKIYAVGFGNAINTGNLSNLTVNTGGAYYTGTNAPQMATEFAQINKAITGQYRLRWATTRRNATLFMPSFVINYGAFSATSPPNPSFTSNYFEVVDTNATPPTNYYSDYTTIPMPLTSTAILSTNTTNWTNFIISYYNPSKYAGNVLQGNLHFADTPDTEPAGVTLTADYIPRYIRSLLIHYRANWPCVFSPATNSGDLLNTWSMVTSSDGSNGTLVSLSSPDPTSPNGITTSLTFGDWGDLLRFQFYDAVPNTNAFALFQVMTNIYAPSNNISGYVGQSFSIANGPGFTASYPSLPYGTPVPWLISYGITSDWTNAETADPDHDGVPTWQEYYAGTNPTNAASAFAIKSVVQGKDGRNQVTFTSAVNRTYTVYSSVDLINWIVVQDGIVGTGAPITCVDPNYNISPNLYYRAQVHL